MAIVRSDRLSLDEATPTPSAILLMLLMAMVVMMMMIIVIMMMIIFFSSDHVTITWPKRSTTPPLESNLLT